MRRWTSVLLLAAMAIPAIAGPDDVARKTLSASRLTGPAPSIDGDLNEAVWAQSAVASGFVQRSPNPGMPARQKTEVRLLYNDEALFVAARMHDTSPDSIDAQLFRRDTSGYFSDWFYVMVDSYNDQRTAWNFAVNPKGVKKDVQISNDTDEDVTWDAVWDAAARVDDQGWTAELRIPLSQLRFSESSSASEWGINFQRRIPRYAEFDFWSPTLPTVNGFVSQFGQLVNLEDLKPKSRIEVVPYTASRLERLDGDANNPLYRENALFGAAGVDIKAGITSNLTATVTVNPDFGQVEADPALVNLSAFENFFSERRPFFLEGSDIFQFGEMKTWNQFNFIQPFYSRRIGRSPRRGAAGLLNSHGGYFNAPQQTSIGVAGKVSGKLENGLSVGLLNAFTPTEYARYTDESGNAGVFSIERAPVEPRTNYFVGRLRKDYREGRTAIGAITTAVNRSLTGENEAFLGLAPTSSYTTGLDFEHSLYDREWFLSGFLIGSRVAGSSELVSALQTSSARYYQRPDADHLDFDADRSELTGYSMGFSVQRPSGKHWSTSLTYEQSSPGFETNDIGFQPNTDFRSFSTVLAYNQREPQGPFFNYFTWIATNLAFTFGGEKISESYATGGSGFMRNFWRVNYNIQAQRPTVDTKFTRGGPVGRQSASFSGNASVSTDTRKAVSFSLNGTVAGDRSGGRFQSYGIGAEIRPTSALRIETGPSWTTTRSMAQYVGAFQDPLATETFGTRYVSAIVDQQSLRFSARIDWTFSPTMSLQFYAEPFIASGDYTSYREFLQPGTFDFATYGEDAGTITRSDSGLYLVDPDGAGPALAFSFGDRDFNFRSLRGNAVFRWEYRPGSALFLVWQQQREAFARMGDFRLGRDLNELWNRPADNVFLIKLSYWLGA